MLEFQTPGTSGGNLLEHLLLESIGAIRGGGIFAWANASGATTLFEDAIMDEHLQTSDFRLIVGTDSITDTRAIERLSQIAAKRPHLVMSAFVSPTSSLFHPKLAWFEHADHLSLIVGSGNLTMGGLLANWEAFVVTTLSGDGARKTLVTIEKFFTDHTDKLLPLNDPRVIDRVALNVGNERSIRGGKHKKVAPPALAAVASGDDVLVAEIPGSGGRGSQANFNRENYEGFFGAKVGSHRRIVLQSVSSAGLLGDIESRPSVEVASKNYRFELAALKGLSYPASGAPIGVFARLSTGQFLYSLAMPGDSGYGTLDAFLTREWSGPATQRRRVRCSAAQLKAAWPGSALWTADLPDL